MRGAWIDNKLAPTQQAMNTTVHELARLGVNRIYVDAWNNGNVYFPSSTMAAVCPTCVASADLLLWAADAAQSAGISVCAWFEYGLMSGYAGGGATNTFTALAKQRGWYAGDANSFHWMDPSNPEVIALLSGIMADAATLNPSLAALQLDDHFSLPSSLPYSHDRQAAMTTAAKGIWAGVRARSSVPLSLSPNPISISLAEFSVDWVQWGYLGYFTEFVPQLYRAQYSDFAPLLDEVVDKASGLLDRIALGLRCDGSGAPTAWEELDRMVDASWDQGLGVCIWYAHGVTELYPTQFADKFAVTELVT